MNPTAPSEREPVLDVLRGFAVLGILLVNIQVMRGPEWLILLGGGSVEPPYAITDRIAQFAVGWLAAGKFVSSLAFLFGVGAALIAARALRAGQSPRPLLARRYVWLMAFGIAHMLIFPGDILFVYGVTGIALLAFVRLRVSTIVLCAAGIFAAYTALGIGYFASISEAETSFSSIESAETFGSFANEQHAAALAAFTAGSLSDIAAVHVRQALLLQGMQLAALPWILAVFLFGYAAGRTGIVKNLDAHRKLLRRGAWFGLAIGLPANIGLGLAGPLANWGPAPDTEPVWVTQWAAIGDLIGEPILAFGYLCALSLLCLRRGAMGGRLAAVGRMALTAYILQSAAALALFAGLDLYDRLSPASALLVVLAIWALLLIACPLWLRWFRLGPIEWVWRSLTYGQAPTMRIAP